MPAYHGYSEECFEFQVIARILQHKGPSEAAQTAELLLSLGRGVLDYLLQQIGWILQDGSTLWGIGCLASAIRLRSAKTAAPADVQEAGKFDKRHMPRYSLEASGPHLAQMKFIFMKCQEMMPALPCICSKFQHLESCPSSGIMASVCLVVCVNTAERFDTWQNGCMPISIESAFFNIWHCGYFALVAHVPGGTFFGDFFPIAQEDHLRQSRKCQSWSLLDCKGSLLYSVSLRNRCAFS